jgi:uncharacterized protein (TIGR03437 family)
LLLFCFAVSASAQSSARPMALDETRYEVAAGEPISLAASTDALNFLLNATSRSVAVASGEATGLVASPDKTRDQILLAAPLRTKPGEYTATLSATSATGEHQQATLTVVVKPRQTVPSSATRPPVVLLNGWETGFTGSCPVSSNSTETFGNLAQYLMSDGVPVVYFFDNCAEDPNQPIETLANDLGTFLNTITYDNGQQVPQIDLVGFSTGGLIARAYLAGLQTGGSLTPPVNTLVRDLVLIATPNFGSFLATNYASSFTAGTQSAELISGSSFLWNLATWNQRVDDLRGLNAIAIIGNAGSWVNNGTGISLNNGSDGVVSTTSASLGFVSQKTSVIRIVPYCHVDPGSFTNTALGTFNCSAPGIANITGESHPTSQIVRSFLSGTSDWQSIGSTPATDPLLSLDGGTFFATVNGTGSYVTDVTQVGWGTLLLQVGGDQGTIFYNDFVAGTGDFRVTSQSLGTIDCGTIMEAIAYYAAARCKIDTAIISVGPLANVPGRVINPGSAITITGNDFGFLCNGCKVVATPAGATTGDTLSVSSWTGTSITAQLPSSLSGLITISVLSETGNDSITIMVASPSTIAVTPTSLQFTTSVGGTASSSQSIQIANSSSGTLTWTATASAASGGSWLSVAPASGTAPSTISVSVSTAGLGAGTYTGSIQITATGASNTPLAIPVTLTVAAPSPTLTVTPQTLSFQYTAGGAVPDAQTISIANAGGGTLSWTASASDFWLSVSAASGTAPASLSVSVNPANLAAGTYAGSVQISSPGATGSPALVAVMLVVQGNQPAGTIAGITNAASYQPGFAPAAWVAIFGTNLSQTTYGWQAADFVNGQLPTSLHGVSVTINGIPAYVQYISPTQINVLAPDDASLGAGSSQVPVQVAVQVTTAGQASNTINGQEQEFAPAFFTIGSSKYVAAEHADYTLIGPTGLIPGVVTQPAQPGETVMLYGTGFGPTNPVSPTGQLVTMSAMLPANSVEITIGGVNASVSYAGLVEAGVYQFNVTIPSGLANGDAAVVATIDGVQTQTGVSITVQQ